MAVAGASDAAIDAPDIVDVGATAVVAEFACVIMDELAAADMDELDAFTDEFEAYTCCMQHIKNNANFRR